MSLQFDKIDKPKAKDTIPCITITLKVGLFFINKSQLKHETKLETN